MYIIEGLKYGFFFFQNKYPLCNLTCVIMLSKLKLYGYTLDFWLSSAVTVTNTVFWVTPLCTWNNTTQHITPHQAVSELHGITTQ
jgi:hypothetical protein